MRRMTAVCLGCVAAALIAGCGSSGSRGAPANPTIDALSYFPATSPFVVTLQTAPHSQSVKQAQALERSNPSYAVAETALFAQLAHLGIDYNKDIRPLFGNPLALGAVAASGSGSQSPFLAAWVTKSPARLTALIKKLKGLHGDGSRDGAHLYAGTGVAAAIAGPTLVLARSVAELDAALDRHAHRQGIDSAAYTSATAGISSTGVIEMFGDLTGVLTGPRVAIARRVPWVAAIRRYGVSVSASPSALTIRYHIDTSGRSLSATELPIASGSTAPSLAGDGPIQAAVRDPAQVVQFIETVFRETQPGAYAKFLRQQAQLTHKSGFNLNALIGMLTGDLAVESDTRTTIARAQLSNPARARTMLASLARAEASGTVHKSSQLTSIGDGMYSLPASGQKVTIGILGDQLVVGKATEAQLKAFASAPASGASFGSGAVAFQIALPQLVQLALKKAPSAAEQQLLGLIGNLTGSAGATTSGLTGSATIALK